MDYIAEEGNLISAFLKVAQKGGSGGIDNMQSFELVDWIRENVKTLQKSLFEGTYKPMSNEGKDAQRQW